MKSTGEFNKYILNVESQVSSRSHAFINSPYSMHSRLYREKKARKVCAYALYLRDGRKVNGPKPKMICCHTGLSLNHRGTMCFKCQCNVGLNSETVLFGMVRLDELIKLLI